MKHGKICKAFNDLKRLAKYVTQRCNGRKIGEFSMFCFLMSMESSSQRSNHDKEREICLFGNIYPQALLLTVFSCVRDLFISGHFPCSLSRYRSKAERFWSFSGLLEVNVLV